MGGSSDSSEDYYEMIDIRHEHQLTGTNVTIATCTLEQYTQIPCWAFNRKLDHARVIELRKAIRESGFVQGSSSIARCDDRYYIVDGQHRQAAIKQLIGKTLDADQELALIIYDVDDDEEIIDLFVKVNNTKPLDPKDTPNSIIIKVVKKLGADFKTAIVFDKVRTVYPYILAKELQERLSNINLDGISEKRLYTEIRNLNRLYENRCKKDNINIPNMRNNKKSIEKARSTGFYLGLNEKWSWIEALDKRLRRT